MKNDFTKARRTLVGIYLLIIGCVVVLFSTLVVYQASDSFSDPAVKTDAHIAISKDEAVAIAQRYAPEKTISESEYEIEKGKLYFTIKFSDETEVKVDLFTGVPLIPIEDRSLVSILTDDFDEIVGWIALVVFSLASLLCIYVANKTLAPISRNIQKQKQFISDAAHELRNPLAAMHAHIESLLHSGGETFKKEILLDLFTETKHLISMSETLLAFERKEYAKQILKVESLRIQVAHAVKRLGYLATEKHIRVEIEVPDVPVEIDVDDLQVVLYNLIHNAIKFTPANGSVTITGVHNTLSVVDTGIGIPAESVPYIFDRFYKVDTARSDGGNGLGLALVKEILDRYDATISVLSVVGTGTTITVHFK